MKYKNKRDAVIFFIREKYELKDIIPIAVNGINMVKNKYRTTKVIVVKITGERGKGSYVINLRNIIESKYNKIILNNGAFYQIPANDFISLVEGKYNIIGKYPRCVK